jgi:hypothetical protein
MPISSGFALPMVTFRMHVWLQLPLTTFESNGGRHSRRWFSRGLMIVRRKATRHPFLAFANYYLIPLGNHRGMKT